MLHTLSSLLRGLVAAMTLLVVPLRLLGWATRLVWAGLTESPGGCS